MLWQQQHACGKAGRREEIGTVTGTRHSQAGAKLITFHLIFITVT